MRSRRVSRDDGMPRARAGMTGGIPARSWVGLGLVGVVLLLAACAAPGGTSGGGPTGAVPPVAPTVTPVPMPPGAAPDPLPTPTVMDPVTGARERRLVWTLVRSGGNELVVQTMAGGPPCDAVTGLDVTESASSVTVTVWSGRVPGAAGCDGPQPAMVGIFWIRVPLSAPLGARSVVPGG
ncbi:MAG: hypothetical protein V9G08_10950 [Dermatophilaceae bacterium]